MPRRSPVYALLVNFVLLAALANPATASNYEQITDFGPAVPMMGGAFGEVIAVDGDVVVVGLPNEGLTGAAYVMRYNGTTWVEEQRLAAGDGFFGIDVEIDGDLIIIGSGFDDGDRGAAYVYRYDGSTWVEEQKLAAAGAVPLDQAGFGVAIDGDVALVGALGFQSNRGAVYAFRYNGSTWVEEQQLLASDGESPDSFGQSVALHGDRALIGAYFDDSLTGSAYVFEYDGSSWVETQKLTASDAETSDGFGVSVALEGDAALIGAFQKSATPINLQEGAAYVFRHNGTQWIEEQKLLPADLSDVGLFGIEVAIEGSTALIGAVLTDGGGVSEGAAYIFEHDGSSWTEATPRLSADDADDSDFFGASVALQSPFAFVGCIQDDDVEQDSGSVYVFGNLACLEGSVNAGSGSVVDVLGVNGSTGGADRTVQLADGDFVEVLVVRPLSGGNGGFVLHADVGTPDIAAQAALPFDVGLTCFPFLLSNGAAPVIVANSIGKENLVGESSYFGTPTTDPDRATTTFYYQPLPLGTVLTFQAVIIDPASLSSKSASTTNAVIVEVVP